MSVLPDDLIWIFVPFVVNAEAVLIPSVFTRELNKVFASFKAVDLSVKAWFDLIPLIKAPPSATAISPPLSWMPFLARILPSTVIFPTLASFFNLVN